jgi:hypothetical protein
VAEAAAKMAESMSSFISPAQALTSALTGFGSNSSRLVDALSKFPTNVEHTGRFEVSVTGLEGAKELESAIGAIVDRRVAAALRQENERRFPESSAPLRSDPTSLR